MVQHCARCKRRMVVSYHVPEEIKRLVLLNRWKSGVCALAYRRELGASREDRLAWQAAYAAFREVLPEMPVEQAKVETAQAIAYAAAQHAMWFWGGVYG
jgi:hypothetical protein